jgi:hypothetical protein
MGPGAWSAVPSSLHSRFTPLTLQGRGSLFLEPSLVSTAHVLALASTADGILPGLGMLARSPHAASRHRSVKLVEHRTLRLLEHRKVIADI